MNIRPVKRDDSTKLLQIGLDTGIFEPGEAEELLGQTLVDLFDGKLPDGHQAHLVQQDASIKGWVYFGPMNKTNVWNLWWIGVDPNAKGKGFGKMLLKFVEDVVAKSNASKLLIETSSSSLLEHTRDFYTRQLYTVSHVDANAYGQGEDKVVFYKHLTQ